MSLFNLPSAPQDPPAKSIALSLLAHANRALSERIAEHRARFREFWDSPVPPAAIAAEMGAMGAQYIAAASESVRHIATLAGLAGQTLDDVLAPDDYMPRLPLTANDDGTLTVGTGDGLDAWGRVPPQPTSDHEPTPDL
jgi:hypothetical protein